jgi:hypothetical protein
MSPKRIGLVGAVLSWVLGGILLLEARLGRAILPWDEPDATTETAALFILFLGFLVFFAGYFAALRQRVERLECRLQMGEAFHAAWDDPSDRAAWTLPEVSAGLQPVLLVIHHLGTGNGVGGWLFLDGKDLAARRLSSIAKVDLLRLDPELTEITDLPVGWKARRDAPGQPWKREQS